MGRCVSFPKNTCKMRTVAKSPQFKASSGGEQSTRLWSPRPFGRAPEGATRRLLALVIGAALAMISKRFDNAAVADAAMTTLLDHSRQLSSKGLQAGYPSVDFGKVALGYAVSSVTRGLRLGGHGQQCADVFHIKAQLPRVPDEIKPVSLRLTVAALIALRPRRFSKQPDLFVEPDRRHLDASSP